MVTFLSRIDARLVAKRVFADKLAACPMMLPGFEPYFMWKDEMKNSPEYLVMIKTTEKKLKPLFKEIKELHQYEVPEIIALEIKKGSVDYLKWVCSELR